MSAARGSAPVGPVAGGAESWTGAVLNIAPATGAPWTPERAVRVAHLAGFASSTCWTMGPEELVHLLNVASSAIAAGAAVARPLPGGADASESVAGPHHGLPHAGALQGAVDHSIGLIREGAHEPLVAGAGVAPVKPVAQQVIQQVTPSNVGRWCLSEDDCRAAGIDFAGYERGVRDAAEAFSSNKPNAFPAPAQPLTPSPPEVDKGRRHYPEEWGPSSHRRLTCACGNPDPAHMDAFVICPTPPKD